MQRIITNQFGSASLTPVTEFMKVADINMVNLPVIEEHMITITEAEQLALITNLNQIQLCLPYSKQQGHPKQCHAYAVIHQNASVACVCKVEVDFIPRNASTTAEQEIKNAYAAKSSFLA